MTSSRLRPALLLLCCCLLSRAAELQLFEAVEPHMGTLFRIKLYAESEGAAKAAFRVAFERVQELDETLSDYRADSELSRLTVVAVGHPTPVSPDLFRVLSEAQELAAKTEGAFDITLGLLTHLWRAARKAGQLPSPDDLQAAAAKCGYRKLHLNRQDHTVEVDETGMLLDAGGIGKGYAADEALAVLRAQHLTQALVAASGDLAFSDPPPGQAGWRIGIDSIDEAGRPFTKVLMLRNSAVSTSGDSEQHLDSGKQRYSHVLDPRTGMGLTHRLKVTVVAPTGLQADALTKVVSVWGRERGVAFTRNLPGVEVFVVGQEAN